MFGVLLVGAFATVVLAYMFTEYLLTRLDVRRRVLVGDGSPLTPIIYANAISFLVVCLSSFVVLFAVDAAPRPMRRSPWSACARNASGSPSICGSTTAITCGSAGDIHPRECEAPAFRRALAF